MEMVMLSEPPLDLASPEDHPLNIQISPPPLFFLFCLSYFKLGFHHLQTENRILTEKT